MDEIVPLDQVYPLAIKNYFHPLSNNNEEEDAQRIVIVVMPIIVSFSAALIRHNILPTYILF